MTDPKASLEEEEIEVRLLKQRAYSKVYYQKNKKRLLAWQKKYRVKNSKRQAYKIKANKNCRRTLRRAGVQLPEHCLINNSRCAGRLEAHHADYRKPLDVIVLCNRHHKAWHRVFLPEE